jgi:pSer/pThr/pTyr-binding forkhead associated (FHA) protein
MVQRVKGLHLVVHPPDGTPRTHEISKRVTRIGRDETNDLTIFSETISRKHAALIITPEDKHRFYIEDLHSRNGTRINGELINDRSPIKVGDVIMLANDVTIILRDDEFDRESELDRTQPIQPVSVQTPDMTTRALVSPSATSVEAPASIALPTIDGHAGTFNSDIITKDIPTDIPTPDLGFLFISHSSRDIEMARKISQTLRRNNIQTWLDDEQIDIGENWNNVISRAIKESWGALILISRHSLASLQCIGERQSFERAYQKREKQIYFLLLEDIPPDELPYTVPVIQYTNLAADFHGGMERLQTAIVADRQRYPSGKLMVDAPADVFISHSYLPADGKILHAVRRILRGRGISVWDHGKAPEPGTPDWHQVIPKAIEASKCVLVVMSPEAKSSNWVSYEIDRAIQHRKPVIGLYVRGSSRSLFQNRFDAQISLNRNTRAGMSQLLTQLRKRGIDGEK